VNSTSIPIGVGANFYDASGNLVAGLEFYPPEVVNNKVTVDGGLFIGTDLTPFINSATATPTPAPTTVASAKVAKVSSMVSAETMLKNFGKSKVKVDNRLLTAKYYAVDHGKKRDVKFSDSSVAQKYLDALQKVSKVK
jgi:hypothetical protein